MAASAAARRVAMSFMLFPAAVFRSPDAVMSPSATVPVNVKELPLESKNLFVGSVTAPPAVTSMTADLLCRPRDLA
eukprot:6956477-Prymnesium_polylepis.1